MPVNLIPIPERPDVPVPTSDDSKAIRQALTDLIQDWNRVRGILRQNVNRLDAPQANLLGALRSEVLDLGRLLAALVHGELGESLDGLEDSTLQITTGDVRRIVGKYRRTKWT